MKTNREHFLRDERGNALIYVLIAIALFAALSMTLGRQTDTGEAGEISAEKAEIYATEMAAYTAQVKSAVDQMLFTGTAIDDLDFTLPTDPAFNTPPHINKVYHPEGGGVVPGRIPAEIVDPHAGTLVQGWYMGRFNNVEWTKTAGEDVILVAYGIARSVCAKINEKINGTGDIPPLDAGIPEAMIDFAISGKINIPFTTDPAGTPICADCHKMSSLCVEDENGAYGFYTIIADQ